MTKIEKMCKIFIITVFITMICTAALADRVIFNNGEVLKGVVVEKYKDRITFSTFEGEKLLMKGKINSIEYDTPEDNLLKLAIQHQDQEDYKKAFFYYSKAYKLNPDSKAAKDGFILSQQAFFKKEQLLQQGEVEKRKMIERFRRTGSLEEGTEDTRNREIILKDAIGLSFRTNGINPQVTAVDRKSPTAHAGIKRGDKIVAVWSRLTGYLSKEEILTRLTDPTRAELKFTIERKLKVKKNKPSFFLRSIRHRIGADLVIKYEGLTVTKILAGSPAESAGLEVGDLIEAIDTESTRYMNLKKAQALINKTSGDVNFVIRRELTVWKEKMGGL